MPAYEYIVTADLPGVLNADDIEQAADFAIEEFNAEFEGLENVQVKYIAEVV